MANNRMYLKCKKDGALLPIAKYSPECGWLVGNIGNRLSEAMDAFFETHNHTRDGDGYGDFCLVHEVGAPYNESVSGNFVEKIFRLHKGT